MPWGQGIAAGDADHQPEVGPDEPVLGGSGVGHGRAQLGARLAGVQPLAGLAAGLDDARQLLSSSAVRRGTLPISLRYRPIESFMSGGRTWGIPVRFREMTVTSATVRPAVAVGPPRLPLDH